MTTISKEACPYCESTNYYQEIYMECINCGHKEKINSSGLESHIKEIGNNWDANLVNSLQSKIDELISWKERAMEVMSPIQEIGKTIGVRLGESIHDKILPFIRELRAENSGLRYAISELTFRNDKCNEHIYELQQRIVELESAFAGSEEMVKDKIKKITESEKAILLLTEVVDEQQQRLNNYDL